jgi:hypothetical protein
VNGSTAYTLSTAQSGSIIQVPAIAAACVLTLPPVANSAGTQFTVVCSGTLGQTLAITAQSACMRGFSLQPAAVGVAVQTVSSYSSGAAHGTAATSLTLQAACTTGDRVSIICDGISWFVQGWSGRASATQAMIFA